MAITCDYLIVGGGVIGMAIARSLVRFFPNSSIIVVDKEPDVAQHASGRNSGVLHAGFYYTADSLKAKFTVEGNRQWKAFCQEHRLPINECGKLVVAQNQDELTRLSELQRRGIHNGSTVSLISAAEAQAIDPNVRTYKKALWSPNTASVDPEQCCAALKKELEARGVRFMFDCAYLGREGGEMRLSQHTVKPKMLINAAGLYADKVARDFGFGDQYTMIPFKGLYLKYTKDKEAVRTHIYPVPNLAHPFLGVHYTKTVDGAIKIGPTATPAFWRENYEGWGRFDILELVDTLLSEASLFALNSFGFRDLALEEMKKYNRRYYVGLAAKMVQAIDQNGFTTWTRPGIRAQLLDKKQRQLVQDFVVEADNQSVHILNAVSPAFTCAFPFADYVVERYITGK